MIAPRCHTRRATTDEMNESEQVLASRVVCWLDDLEWDVYQEVQVASYSRIADIVAVRDGILWTLEVKRSCTLAVMEQADGWRGYAHYRSIAVPASGRHRMRKFTTRLCQLLGIGIVLVGSEVWEEEAPRFDRKVCARLRDCLRPEHRTYAPAGNATGRRWSPFRATCDAVLEFVSEHPGCAMKDLVSGIRTHYRTPASARSALRKWIAARCVPGVESRVHDGKLRVFCVEVAQ